MKRIKLLNILTLILMVLFIVNTLVFASQKSMMKANFSKPTQTKSAKPKMAAKNKTAKTIMVKISGFAFNPKMITINKGDTVIWTNLDSMAHTVTSSSFDSGNMNMNATFKYTFNTSGTFNYVCTYHQKMTATVIVK
jgi:plastocyanin